MNSSVNKRHLWKTVWVWAVIAHERWRHMDFCEFQASLVSLFSVFQTSHSKINYLIHCSHRTVPSIVWLGFYKGGCISLLKKKQKRAAHVSNKCGLLFLKKSTVLLHKTIFHCAYALYFLYQFTQWWMCRSFLYLDCSWSCYSELGAVDTCLRSWFQFIRVLVWPWTIVMFS